MNLNNILIFTFGAAIGTAVTWKVTKNYYEKLTQEEIDSVKEMYSNRSKGYTQEELKETVEGILKDEAEREVIEKIEEHVQEYEDIIECEGYTSIEDFENDREEVSTMDGKPYVISPDVFGDRDYRMVEITYFADKVMVDDDGDVLTLNEIEEKIGNHNLNTFGKFENDRIFVRNDDYETDYEILLDDRIYSEEYRDELEDEFDEYNS